MENSTQILAMLENQGKAIESLQKGLLASKKVLTIDEVSIYTGLSKSYLYKLNHERKIPYHSPNGKSCFYDREEIDEWLLRNPVRTVSQLKKSISSGSKPIAA